MESDAKSLAVWAKDAGERIVATFIVSGLGTLTVTSATGVESLDLSRAGLALSVAGAAAAGSLVKALVARYIGDRKSASLDPSLHVDEVTPRG